MSGVRVAFGARGQHTDGGQAISAYNGWKVDSCIDSRWSKHTGLKEASSNKDYEADGNTF